MDPIASNLAVSQGDCEADLTGPKGLGPIWFGADLSWGRGER